MVSYFLIFWFSWKGYCPSGVETKRSCQNVSLSGYQKFFGKVAAWKVHHMTTQYMHQCFLTPKTIKSLLHPKPIIPPQNVLSTELATKHNANKQLKRKKEKYLNTCSNKPVTNPCWRGGPNGDPPSIASRIRSLKLKQILKSFSKEKCFSKINKE